MPLILLINGCSDIPACEGYYTKKGVSEAIRELYREYQAAIRLARDNGNRILLSEVREITQSRDFRKMEEFSCNAQEAHGRL
jgi:hypothetical protein